MPEGSTGADREGTLLTWALVWAVLALTATVLATQSRFDRVDQLTRVLVHRVDPHWLRSSMDAVSFLGGAPGQITLVVLASGTLWGRRRRWALALPGITAGAAVLQLLVKWAVERPRPNLDPWGFPSAHVLTVVVLLGCLGWLVRTSGARRLWRGLGLSACTATVCAVAYSRLYLDAHWLSDILGGLSLGIAYLLGAIWLVSATDRPETTRVQSVAPLGSLSLGSPAIGGQPLGTLIEERPTLVATVETASEPLAAVAAAP